MSTIAQYEVKIGIKPIPESKFTLSYGRVEGLKKISDCIGNENELLIVRQTALTTLAQLLCKPENVIHSIHVGIPPILLKLISNPDIDIRLRTSESILRMVEEPTGQTEFLQLGAPRILASRFNDDIKVRLFIYQILETISFNDIGCRKVVELGLTNSIIQHVRTQSIETRGYVLSIVRNIVKHIDGAQLALDVGVLECCEKILNESNTNQSYENACWIICSISNLCQDGKNMAVTHNLIPLLSNQLKSNLSSLTFAASSALMSITISVEGKSACIENDLSPQLIRLLYDPDIQIQIVVINCIINISENPIGKQVLQSCLEHLNKIKISLSLIDNNNSNDIYVKYLSKATNKAISQLNK
jgi:DNA-binding protein YbaB